MKECISNWLKAQFGDDEPVIAEVYAEYRRTLARLLDELAEARTTGNPAVVDRVLHTIKGSAAIVGDTPVSTLAQESRTVTDFSKLAEVERRMRTMMEEL